ncbi:MAG: alginate export family protein [Candidatus Omnitrophica bacterium]|nr:alginate export family protein [Candidatus Omnitrophota bacterium]
MSKRLILILALAFVVGLAVSAYAAVQNVKVSGDLLVRGAGRNSYQLTDTNEKQDAILSAVRVRIDADLTDNVATTVRLLNERVWGKEGTAGGATSENDSDIDLDLAYVTLKEFLYSPLTLVVGRQELRYGNTLIIGDIDTNATATADSNLPSYWRDLSVRKAFDAVKATLNYDPLVVDLVYAKIEENAVATANDVNLWGLNANYALRKDLTAEGYLWSRDRSWGSTGMTTTPGQGERLNTLGARTVYTGIENLTLGLEGAWQFGDHYASTSLYPDELRTAGTKSKVNAYALQLVSNYALPKVKYNPAINLSYTRLSGDKDRSVSDNYTGWNPMFEDQAGGTIFNRIVGYSNAQVLNLGSSMKPMDDLTVKLDWHHIRILQTYNIAADATRDLSGIGADTDITVKGDKKHLADEIDLGLTYDYTEDVQLGLTTGLYIPGAVYDKVNKKTASQVIGSMKVTF